MDNVCAARLATVVITTLHMLAHHFGEEAPGTTVVTGGVWSMVAIGELITVMNVWVGQEVLLCPCI